MTAKIKKLKIFSVRDRASLQSVLNQILSDKIQALTCLDKVLGPQLRSTRGQKVTAQSVPIRT